MSKPFDAAAKSLIDADPLAWIRYFGMNGQAATVVDSDLNLPITADRLIRVSDPEYLAHFELQVSRDEEAEHRYSTYGAIAGYKFKLPVKTTIILLREQADHPSFTGLFKFGGLTWEYEVYRLWKMSPELLLVGPPVIKSLAPLSAVTEKQMPGLIRDMRAELSVLPFQEQRDLWGLADILMGMKYNKEYVHEQLKGVYQMLDLRESTTAQGLLEEGRLEGEARGERKMLLHTGIRRLGPPDEQTRAAIEAINSPQELERLADRLYEVETWADLLR